MRSRSVIVVAGFLLTTACEKIDGTGPADGSDGGDGKPKAERTTLDSAKYCNLVVNQCLLRGGTVNACVSDHDLVRVTAECREALAKATCDNILDINSLCFPPCSTSAVVCNEDNTITSCNDAVTVTISCADGCRSNGATYSGTCGKQDPNTGETSATDKCWCKY